MRQEAIQTICGEFSALATYSLFFQELSPGKNPTKVLGIPAPCYSRVG